MKKIIALLAALLIVLGTLTAGVASAKSDFVIKKGVLTKYNGHNSRVVVPEGVTEIAAGVFRFQHMESLTLPSTLKVIGPEAFLGVEGLASITIPASVEKIACGALRGNTNGDLQAILVESGNKHYKSVDGVLLTKNGKELLCYPSGKQGATYAIPAKVKIIRELSMGNTVLQSITIPSSVKTIEKSAFYVSCLRELTIPSTVKSFDLGSFELCTELKKLTIKSNSTKVTVPRSGLSGVSSSLKIYAPADHPVKKIAKTYGIKFKAIEDEALIITGIKLNKTKATLKKGETLTVKVKEITPRTAAGQELKWTTSDKKVATVDKNGKIKAVKKGTCVITCASKKNSKIKAEVKITVK